MGDMDVVKQLREKIRKALTWQERVKKEAESAAMKEEERERQERP